MEFTEIPKLTKNKTSLSVSSGYDIAYYSNVVNMIELYRGEESHIWESDKMMLSGLILLSDKGINIHDPVIAHQSLIEHIGYSGNLSSYKNALTRLVNKSWVKRKYGTLLFNKLLADAVSGRSVRLEIAR